ncbi:MAG: hypothetical protein NC082_08830, partial [Clostridiales bacterium]|nr:hypothetical protein [Clostridiales bacterium]
MKKNSQIPHYISKSCEQIVKFVAKKVRKTLADSKIVRTFALQTRKNSVTTDAKIAQLVEHNLAKVGVA